MSTSRSVEGGRGGSWISKENLWQGLSNSDCNDDEGAISGRANSWLSFVLDCVVELVPSRRSLGGVDGKGTDLGSGVWLRLLSVNKNSSFNIGPSHLKCGVCKPEKTIEFRDSIRPRGREYFAYVYGVAPGDS